MKKSDLLTAISGQGYARLAALRRKMAVSLLGGSALAFILIFILISAWAVIVLPKREEATVLISAPSIRKYEPRKLALRQKLQLLQKSSRRPSRLPRMVSSVPSVLEMPALKVDPARVRMISPDFTPVQAGIGVSIGEGLKPGGFNREDVSIIDSGVFRFPAEKLAILVDVSSSMIEPQMGGVAGFMAVKDRIGKVIDSLNPKTLFNVIVFADAASAWQSGLQPANESNKRAAKMWLQPFNASEANAGLANGNVKSAEIGLRSDGGTTRLDLALTAAFMNRADAILVIGDGIPRVRKVMSPEERDEWNRMLADWEQRNGAAQEPDEKVSGSSPGGGATHRERIWVEKRSSDSDRIVSGQWEWRTVTTGAGAGSGRREGPSRPAMPDRFKWWTLADFIEHFRILHEDTYVKRGAPLPKVYCIGYRVDTDGQAFLKAFARHYNGDFRRVGTMSPK